MYVSIDQRCTKSGTEAVLRSSLIDLNNDELNVNISLWFVIPIVPPFLGLSCSNIYLRTHHGSQIILSSCVIGSLVPRSPRFCSSVFASFSIIHGRGSGGAPPLPCIILNENRRTKNRGGLGTRLCNWPITD